MPNSIDIQIGKRLKAARARAGLSRIDLALALGLTEASMAMIEMGVRRLGPALMLTATQKLGIPVADLFRDVSVARQAVSA
jgi:transcriptional regulator with XRE-family HTH domain